MDEEHSVALFPAEMVQEEVVTNSYMNMPVASLLSLGSAFSPITINIEKITSEAGKQLFTINNRGYSGTLAKLKDGSGYTSTILGSHGMGQVGLNEYGGKIISTTYSYNPAMFLIAAAVFSIDKKLDEIKDTQEEILSIIKEKDRARHKNNLKLLNDILSSYKFNWNNETYKQVSLIQIKDITKDSGEDIEFYQKQIIKRLDKGTLLHTDSAIRNRITKIQEDMAEYQLVLYTYAFASFLDVILLENFNKFYIDNIIADIESRSYEYRKIYTDCYNKLEKYTTQSVNRYVNKGLANVNKVAGEVISKVPVINKTQIDENLVAIGAYIEKSDNFKYNKTANMIVSSKESCVHPFVDRLNTVKDLFNKPLQIYFDSEKIYLYEVKEA